MSLIQLKHPVSLSLLTHFQLGCGTDTAMETADIVLMADNLDKLPHTIKLSKKL